MDRPYAVLTLDVMFGGSTTSIHPVVLFGKHDVVLVDCGYPGSLEALEGQLRLQGVDPRSITRLVLTHHDDDHLGAAAEIIDNYPEIRVLASLLEEPYITGREKSLRLVQAQAMYDHLPDDQKPGARDFCARLQQVRPVAVDTVLYDGDVFDWGGGCEILLTPGHTPGHLSIRALSGAFVVTGDAAVVEHGALAVANPEFCLDRVQAARSLQRLVETRCQRFICFHGGLLDTAPPT